MSDPITQLAEDKKRHGIHECCGRVATGPHSMGCGVVDVSAVTRIHILPVRGLTTAEFWADSWKASLQDEGRTLKLFAHGTGTKSEAERNEALARDFEEMARAVRARLGTNSE